MNIIIDLHVHTLASGHATKDTLTDCARAAKNKGLKALGVCDHAPAMPAAAKSSYFRNLAFCDKKIFGTLILYGAELNILNSDGEVDLPEDILSRLDYAVASLHKDVYKPINARFDTAALINAMKNPYVGIIGHPFDDKYDIDERELVYAAKETGTAIELNSVGLKEGEYRKQNLKKVVSALKLAKETGVYITLGSDSHGADRIGDFGESLKLLEEIGFPENFVLNDCAERFRTFINNKRKGAF